MARQLSKPELDKLIGIVSAWWQKEENKKQYQQTRVGFNFVEELNKNFPGTSLEGLDLRGLNLEGANLQGFRLCNINLEGVNLENANLKQVYLYGASLKGANLKNANLIETSNPYCHIQEADLSGADLRFSGWEKGNYGNENATKTNFTGANLSGLNYQNSFKQINFKDSVMRNTVLIDSDIQDLRSFFIEKGAICDREQLQGLIKNRKDLSNINLNGIALGKIDLKEAKLKGAKLIGTSILTSTGRSISGNDFKLHLIEINADIDGAIFEDKQSIDKDASNNNTGSKPSATKVELEREKEKADDIKGPVSIPYQALQIGELIGNGSFGDVHQGIWSGKEVAIKLLQMKTLAPHLAENFRKEAQLMWQCQSPHILTLYGICTESGHYAMVMEHMKNGSLYKVLHNQDIPEQHRWQIAIDMAKGLAYLHSQNILHRDLKSFNILLDNNYRAKISDFGLAKLKLETSSASTSRKNTGTVRWRAPELFERRAVATPASDIYSYGMVLWELIAKKLPFEDAADEITVLDWISNKRYKEDIPANCPLVWKKIIEACWSAPEKRPIAEQIVAQLEAARPLPTEKPQAKPWHFDATLKPEAAQVKGPVLLKAPVTGPDFKKAVQYYERYPVPGYDIKSVEIIYNPAMNRSFSLKMELLQERDNNSAFNPKWSTDGTSEERDWRKAINQHWRTLSAPHQDSDYSAIQLMPLWHGTKSEALDGIFRAGYANLGTTDVGFFGRGIYSTHEAEYADRVYSKGSGILILNWVATYSAYPVIKGDVAKLAAKGNFGNYDAHFAPVIPENSNDPKEENYYPTAPQQKAQYHELVVFDSAQCLPRYLVTLQETLTHSLGNLGIAQKPIQAQPIIQSTSKPSAIDDKPKKESQPMLFSNSSQGKQTSLASSLPASSQSSSSSSNVLIFTPPPAKIVTTSLTIPNVNPQELAKFLKLVADGEQDKAEAMLKANKDLSLVSGDVTDLSKRTFKGITAFQYALWALDAHMWTMLLKYIPIEHACEHAKKAETGSWVSQYGVHANLDKLTNALGICAQLLNQVFNQLLNQQKWSEADTCWVRQVGGAQLLLPAHVINEYCHSKRSFNPCPDFTKLESNGAWRSRQTNRGEWFTGEAIGGSLGNKFAVVRGERREAVGMCGWGQNNHGLQFIQGVLYQYKALMRDAGIDQVWVRALYDTRMNQRANLITELKKENTQKFSQVS